MAKGKAQANYLHREGLVGHSNAPDWNFIYDTSTIKDSKWNIGDRVVLPDGRVFRYCKSAGQCNTYIANVFYNAIPATGIDYSLLAAAAAVGDTKVVLTNQGTVAQTEDGLRGGNINFGVDNNLVQQRGIIGNTAGGVSDEITVYLDGPLVTALTTSDYAYCMPSPFSSVVGAATAYGLDSGTQGKVSFVGYAAVGITAAGVYHWEQTWGLMPGASLYGSAVGKTKYMREVVFRFDGNLIHRGATGVTGLEAQTAGFIVDNNALDNGATMIMLQISP